MRPLLLLLAAAVTLSLAPAAEAGCPQNPPKPTTIDGQRVKPRSCGPYMMKVAKDGDTSNGYYDCSDLKGKPLKARFDNCKLLNGAKPKAPARHR
jgi:hypothetical protein